MTEREPNLLDEMLASGEKVTIDADEMTLGAIDHMQKLKRSGLGTTLALVYAHLHWLDKRVNLAQVRALKNGQLNIVTPDKADAAPAADAGEVDDDDDEAEAEAEAAREAAELAEIEAEGLVDPDEVFTDGP